MSMHRVPPVLLLMGLLILWNSCTSGSKTLSQPRLVPQQSLAASTLAINREERSSTKQEYISIYRIAGDDWQPSWRPQLPPEVSKVSGKANGDATTTPDTSRYGKLKRLRGFRVQLANVTDEGSAKRIEKRAYSLFKNVYVIFQSPTYKVRAGDFTRRSDADVAASEARRMGFRGAWVVPDQVNVYVGGPPPPARTVSPDANGNTGEMLETDKDSDR
ncbi:MAG: SPOR domain-containing protein [bacterium]